MKRIYMLVPIMLIIVSSYTIAEFQNDLSLNKNKFKDDIFLPVNDKECSFCHNNIIKHTFQHAPVSDDCQTCHQSTGNKHPRAKLQGFTLTEKMPDLCFVCHEAKNEKSVVHAPVESGDCSSCHSPHGSKFQYFMPKETQIELCFECHDMEYSEKPVIHGAIELDGCKTCHDSHQSNNSGLLIEEKLNLCITCHDNISTEKNAKIQHAPFDDDCNNCHNSHNTKYDHLLTTSKDELCYTCHDDLGLKDAKYIHSVAEDEKGCSNCHSPHASDYDNILIKDQTDLCFSCHNQVIEKENILIENIEEKIKGAKYTHAPIEFGCNECHDPHASDNSALLKETYPRDNYTVTDAENFNLCFNCHDADILKNDASSTNFKNGEQNMHYIHINGEKGRNCSVCHDAHASNNVHLIKSRMIYGTWDMPMNFIAKENGGSCRTGCHTEKEYIRNKTVPGNK